MVGVNEISGDAGARPSEFMSVQIEEKTSTPAEKPFAVPAPVLDGLASRFRSGGLFLLALRNDGSLAWHDPAAGMFFLRYVTPLLQYPELHPGLDARAKLTRPAAPSRFTACSPASSWPLFRTSKNAIRSAHLSWRREESFELTEDVLRSAGLASMDRGSISRPRNCPAYNDTSLQRQARQLLACLRDQLRLSSSSTN